VSGAGWLLALAALTPADPGVDLSPGLVAALEALGGSSGIPDGLGAVWTPAAPVGGQPASLALGQYQAGGTVPVPVFGSDALFVNTAVRALDVRTNALLPDDRIPFPGQFWDIESGATYVRQTSDGSSWGVGITGGSASDRPFHSIREGVLTGLGFYRVPSVNDSAWLFYVVSSSNGQLGHNIPVPGVAYEFHSGAWSGSVGFPFVSLRCRPVSVFEWTFDYAAVTDVETRANLLPAEGVRLFTGFAWTNQSWFRAGRADPNSLLFLYEKRLDAGASWSFGRLKVEALTGFKFDRYFVENQGLSLSGRNRVPIGPAPFFGLQLGFNY
jgi:hypothetical protein